jgi:hypothetical protein
MKYPPNFFALYFAHKADEAGLSIHHAFLKPRLRAGPGPRIMGSLASCFQTGWAAFRKMENSLAGWHKASIVPSSIVT